MASIEGNALINLCLRNQSLRMQQTNRVRCGEYEIWVGYTKSVPVLSLLFTNSCSANTNCLKFGFPLYSVPIYWHCQKSLLLRTSLMTLEKIWLIWDICTFMNRCIVYQKKGKKIIRKIISLFIVFAVMF